MKSGTKRLARLAIPTALGTVLLVLGSVLPTGRLALIALSSLAVCVALMMYGIKWSLAVFALTAALGALLCKSGDAGHFGTAAYSGKDGHRHVGYVSPW